MCIRDRSTWGISDTADDGLYEIPARKQREKDDLMVKAPESSEKANDNDDDDWDPFAVKMGVLNRRTIDCSDRAFKRRAEKEELEEDKIITQLRSENIQPTVKPENENPSVSYNLSNMCGCWYYRQWTATMRTTLCSTFQKRMRSQRWMKKTFTIL
eukprot:TRINITY_DN2040_c0_g1_i3.p2 TRINITY_DN2040_c0_g1~~TRINITY_DN2040_c0_g1_i3.p2  ORF type:complete len:176 (+),score=36.32 TRINITY_DN2040_c0_g1_i3:61-528(+)